jgi:hypothetical protein
MLTEEEMDRLLRMQATIRVWDMQHSHVFCEGEVIAYSMQPTICVRDADGAQHWHVVSLPIEEALPIEWKPL